VTSLSALLLVIGVSGFLLEGARIAVDLPPHEWCSIVGYPLALGLRSCGVHGSSAVAFQQLLWGGHAAACLTFFALLPWGVFGHMSYGLANVALRPERRLSHLPAWSIGPQQPPGALRWNQFAPLDLLQADACTTCGRCNDVCPAAAAGKPLRPRDVVLSLRRNHDQRVGSIPLQLSDDVVWSCTTCAACNHACPVGIDVYDKIVDLRRGRVESGRVPSSAEDVFDAVSDRGNPFGRPPAERLNWARGLNVPVAQSDESIDVLYWVGCSGSFSPEGQAVARAMVKILNRLGVNYCVLGTAERCTGDPARRMGEEGLFRECAARNLSELRSRGVKKVLTHCPHCYNAFRNEYPSVDGEPAPWETRHHTEFLSEQISLGKFGGATRLAELVTFHDPCYLGRGNGIVSPPREAIKGLNLTIVEMPRHGENSFCCGAGGGAMWLDVRGDERIENQRYAEAANTKARILGTACPFCKTMLAAARQEKESAESAGPRVLDVAELVAMSEGL
jgi:Fe-S oxidoreductase